MGDYLAHYLEMKMEELKKKIEREKAHLRL